MNKQDRLYNQRQNCLAPFEFNADVAEVFSDMIRRSVPGYELTLSLLPIVSTSFVPDGGRIYDLGCSLGASMLAATSDLATNAKIIGVDNSSDMVAKCRDNLDKTLGSRTNIDHEVIVQNILETEFLPADLIIMNFTLQFIDLEQREQLIQRLFQALRPGGALLLSEKIQIDSPGMNELLIKLHHDFKRRQGYSELEIMQKRDAIEDVLIPETLDNHYQRLIKSGFASSQIQVWLQCFNFVSMLAVKS